MESSNKHGLLFFIKMIAKSNPIYMIHKSLFTILDAINPSINIILLQVIMNILGQNMPILHMIRILVMFLLYYIIQIIYTTWYQNAFLPKSITNIKSNINKLIFKKIKYLDMKCYDDPKFYDLYTMASAESDTRVIEVIDTIYDLIKNIIGISALSAIIIYIDFGIMIFSLVNLLISVIIGNLINKYRYKYENKRIPFYRRMSYVKRIFSLKEYSKEIKIFNISNILLNLYNDEKENIINTYKESSKRLCLMLSVIGIFSIFTEYSIIFYLVYNVINNKILIGDFIAMVSASQQFRNMLGGIFGFFPKLQNHSLYIDRIKRFLDYKSLIEKQDGMQLKEEMCKIKMENISFAYNDLISLNHINLSISKGEKIAIVGSNGAGKSTLIRLLLRIYEPIDGHIYYNDYKYEECNVYSLRKKISVVFQDFQVYALSIAENILMKPIENKMEENKIWEILDICDLKEKVENLKNGIFTLMTKEFNEDGEVFSKGEIQKLAIARALAMNSEILIMDESSSNIDSIAENKIFEKIFSLYNDKTIIFISHRLHITKNADRIYYMENGEILEQGNFDQLMKKEGKYYNMYIQQYLN